MECVESINRESLLKKVQSELGFEAQKELRTMAMSSDSGGRKQNEPKSKGKKFKI